MSVASIPFAIGAEGPASVSYKVRIPTGVVECSTLDEAIALIRRLQKEGITSTPGRGASAAVRQQDSWGLLARALAAVHEFGSAGITSASLAEWLELPASNSIGPKARIWRRLLEEELGFDSDDVWEHREFARNQRRWFPGPRIKEALKLALRHAAKGASGS